MLTDSRKFTDDELWIHIRVLKEQTGFGGDVIPSARKFWQDFESKYCDRPYVIFRLLEELRNRKATIEEYFVAYVYSNTENIDANLHYLDYRRLKNAEDNAGK